jgi:hypothetical protein
MSRHSNAVTIRSETDFDSLTGPTRKQSDSECFGFPSLARFEVAHFAVLICLAEGLHHRSLG